MSVCVSFTCINSCITMKYIYTNIDVISALLVTSGL